MICMPNRRYRDWRNAIRWVSTDSPHLAPYTCCVQVSSFKLQADTLSWFTCWDIKFKTNYDHIEIFRRKNGEIKRMYCIQLNFEILESAFDQQKSIFICSGSGYLALSARERWESVRRFVMGDIHDSNHHDESASTRLVWLARNSRLSRRVVHWVDSAIARDYQSLLGTA